MSFTRKLSRKFSITKGKEAEYRDLPLSIVWYVVSGCCPNEAWTRSGTRCYQIYSFYFCRWRYEDTLEWCWGPDLREEFRSGPMATGHGNTAVQKQFEKRREARVGECLFLLRINGASTSTTFLCQIARSAASDRRIRQKYTLGLRRRESAFIDLKTKSLKLSQERDIHYVRSSDVIYFTEFCGYTTLMITI